VNSMRTRQNLTWLLMLVAAGILFYANSQLPQVGDPRSPASTHVSPHYIRHSHHETGAPNFVTAVLADYRGYDTLGETTVIFTAGLACLLILGVELGRSRQGEEP
jgi:multicomponent Na+:H+ antiporter subunit B